MKSRLWPQLPLVRLHHRLECITESFVSQGGRLFLVGQASSPTLVRISLLALLGPCSARWICCWENAEVVVAASGRTRAGRIRLCLL